MKVILFGASGMVGLGVLRECLLDNDVDRVVSVVRSPTGRQHDKLRELVHADFLDFSGIEDELAGHDACFFCLGVSSVGMKEAAYHRVTYNVTMAAAQTLIRRSPGLTFVYVSGAGTDSSEKGRSMWARVKGRTENALLRMAFPAKYMFRPAFIQPMHGEKSRTRFLRVLYLFFAPLYPVWKRLFPKYVTTTEQVGHAMLKVAKTGFATPVLENHDINSV